MSPQWNIGKLIIDLIKKGYVMKPRQPQYDVTAKSRHPLEEGDPCLLTI
jgi:hypothetical protein